MCMLGLTDMLGGNLHFNCPKSDKCNSVFVEERCLISGRVNTRLSVEEVVRVAAVRFVRLSILESSSPTLTSDEVRNVELVCHLLSAAEKVGTREFHRAKSLLDQCFLLSSPEGCPVQRVVYHFSKALEEWVFQEIGFSERKDVVATKPWNHKVHLIAYDGLPFSQVVQSISIQAILDSMASAKHIHIIDLSIKHGLQWRLLMQVLATRHSCPVSSLKITAVGTSSEALDPIGNSLSTFAEVLRLPFKFRTVIVRDLDDLRVDMFDREEEESVCILSHLALSGLIVQPGKIEKVMKVIRTLRPHVVAVVDVEAKFNSAFLINRFTEALFYYSAYFDCIHSLMRSCEASRRIVEGAFSEGVKHVLATKGKGRVMRGVGLEVWRMFFARYGLEEIELSPTKEAHCVMSKFVRDGSCTMVRNCKSLFVCWKGTPLHFVSAWKFQ